MTDADEDYGALSQRHLTSIKRDMRVTLEYAAARAMHKVSEFAQAQEQAEPVMLNGLTEAETNTTASVMGLTKQAEPVAWRLWSPDGTNVYQYTEDGDGEPLYTAPPQSKPLTDEEIDQLLLKIVFGGSRTVSTYGAAVARAIEAAHGIKENT